MVNIDKAIDNALDTSSKLMSLMTDVTLELTTSTCFHDNRRKLIVTTYRRRLENKRAVQRRVS